MEDETKIPAEDTVTTDGDSPNPIETEKLEKELESLKKTLEQAEHTIVQLKKSSKSDSTEVNLLAQKIDELNKAQETRLNEFKEQVLSNLLEKNSKVEELQATIQSLKGQGGNPSTTKVEIGSQADGLNKEKLEAIRKQFKLQ